jgi:hypothetical protein
MRAPILVFNGTLRVYPSRSAAERVLAPGGPRALDAFDAAGRPLQLRAGGRGWWGLPRREGVHLEAGPTSPAELQRLRARLADVLVQLGAKQPWAVGAPLGALVAEAAKRLRG